MLYLQLWLTRHITVVTVVYCHRTRRSWILARYVLDLNRFPMQLSLSQVWLAYRVYLSTRISYNSLACWLFTVENIASLAFQRINSCLLLLQQLIRMIGLIKSPVGMFLFYLGNIDSELSVRAGKWIITTSEAGQTKVWCPRLSVVYFAVRLGCKPLWCVSWEETGTSFRKCFSSICVSGMTGFWLRATGMDGSSSRNCKRMSLRIMTRP